MNWTDCTSAWQRQAAPAVAPSPEKLAELHARFDATRRREARALLVRDWLEGGTGLAVAAVFALFWWFLRLPNGPMALAIALVVGVSVFFLRERRRARRARLGADAPLLAKLEADLAELRHQRQLLLSLHVWYLGPLGAAVLLVVAAVTWQLRTRLPAIDLSFSTSFALAYVGILGGVWLLNRHAVRRQIDPRIAELEALRASLQPAG